MFFLFLMKQAFLLFTFQFFSIRFTPIRFRKEGDPMTCRHRIRGVGGEGTHQLAEGTIILDISFNLKVLAKPTKKIFDSLIN